MATDSTETLLDTVIGSLSPQSAADLAFDLGVLEPGERLTFTVICKGDSITFSSTLNDAQARIILANVRGEFAASLRNRQVWSDKQRAWAHKLANDWLQSQSPEAISKASDNEAIFGAIVAILTNVKGRTKAFEISKDCMISLSRCRGKVWVKNPSRIVSGDYGDGPEFIGTISPKWGISDKLPEEIRQQIISFVDSMTH